MLDLKRKSNHHYLNATWLLKLRWVAVIGQLLTIAGSVFLFQMRIPMAWAMAVVIILTVISNLFLAIWFRRWQQIDDRFGEGESPLPWNLILGLVLIMDMLSLTTLLFTSGGPNNPFCLFFFVNLSLCALILNRRWAWAINLLTITCFSVLMVEHQPMRYLDAGLPPLRIPNSLSLQHAGVLVAFATCSSVIVYFMTRLTQELAEQQQQVREAQDLRANTDKIEALGTLAAGTAHELATPLSTIAIVAKDVEQAFEKHPPDFPGAEEVVDDVHLIRSQLERCRKILDRMASHAGQAIGERFEKVSMAELIEATLEGVTGRERVQVTVPEESELRLNVPLDGLSQAMRGLVQNALDADSNNSPVNLMVEESNADVVWVIQDRGSGMSAEQLKRVSEPFYTTKSPGKGMGLGVFLAKNVLRRLGGSLNIESKLGMGTSVTVRLPKDSNR